MVRGGSFIGVSLAGHVVEWSVGRNARRTVSLASLLATGVSRGRVGSFGGVCFRGETDRGE